MTIRVAVVDDQTMACSAFAAVLTMQSDIDVVGEAANGRLGIEASRSTPCAEPEPGGPAAGGEGVGTTVYSQRESVSAAEAAMRATWQQGKRFASICGSRHPNGTHLKALALSCQQFC